MPTNTRQGLTVTDFLANVLRHAGSSPERGSLHRHISELLRAVRTHLGMDVAFVSEFTGGRRVFRCVDAAPGIEVIKVDASDPLDESYCQRIVDGRLPELMRDAAQNEIARAIPATLTLPVGAHLSVPIKLEDGRVYGTFCCFSFLPDHTLNERDLNMMRVFADLTAEKIAFDAADADAQASAQTRISNIFDGNLLSVVYQPIFSLDKARVAGYEALSRIRCEPYRPPDQWFSEALEVGLGNALESRALALAASGMSDLGRDVYLSVNVSPGFVLHYDDLEALIEPWVPEQLVLEITEHSLIEDYGSLVERLQPLRDKGVRIAVDDAGAGYASFRHILHLEPDVIKLDASLTRDIDTHHSRRALAIAFISFGQATGAEIIAEGVETEAQYNALAELGVDKLQGNFIGEPVLTPIAPAPRDRTETDVAP